MAVSAAGPRYLVYFLLFTFCPDAQVTPHAHDGRMAFAFEKLLVYQKSVAFAEAVCTATGRFPRGYYFLADQLNRAGLSIAANLAEGNGRFTAAERRNFFGIARGRVQECVPLLEIAMRRKVVAVDVHMRLRGEHEEISRMVSGLIKGLENRRAAGSTGGTLPGASHSR
jgi:four helix bundle protein